MLDASGFAGNECAPDLDLSAIEVQQITVGESFSIDLLAAGATVTDLDAQGNPTGAVSYTHLTLPTILLV